MSKKTIWQVFKSKFLSLKLLNISVLKRNFWLIRAISLFLVLVISSCVYRSNAQITTVTLSGWQSNPNEQKLLADLFKKFEATHPKIKIKYQVINDQYMDVIKTRLIADAAPDIFYLDAFEAPLLIKSGVIQPLNSYIKKDFDLADIQPTLLNAFKQNGKIYGLPKDFSTLALFYNKKAFNEVGLKQPPKTWQQLLEYSKKLTLDRNNDGRIDQYGLAIAPELPRQYFTIKAFGGQLVDKTGKAAFATPKGLKGLQLIVDQYRKDKSSAQPSDMGASSGSEVFGQGKAAMAIEGSWAIPFLKETFPEINFSTTEIPTINGKKGTMAYTVAYVMNKKSQHKDAAWQVISYLTSKQGMKAWAKEGLVLPSRKSVLTELNYAKNPLYAAFVSGANYATTWQAGEHLPTILNQFNNQFISALIGEQPLAAAMKKAQETANKEIDLAN
ncbi:MAG: ABC transporter substrate-binding protein [Crinalium sp.]